HTRREGCSISYTFKFLLDWCCRNVMLRPELIIDAIVRGRFYSSSSDLLRIDPGAATHRQSLPSSDRLDRRVSGWRKIFRGVSAVFDSRMPQMRHRSNAGFMMNDEE